MADEQETQVGHQVVGEEQAREPEVFFSRDEAQQTQAAPTPPPPSETPRGPTSPAEADRIAADQEDAFAEKPHLYALGAFAGAFVFAQILKRITGDDDD